MDGVLEIAKILTSWLSFLGPWVLMPAFEFFRRTWIQFRQVRGDVHRLLRAFVVMANRERRQLDVMRRLIWQVRFEAKRQSWSPESAEAFALLQMEYDALRDTAFRAREMRAARLAGDSIILGETDVDALALNDEGRKGTGA